MTGRLGGYRTLRRKVGVFVAFLAALVSGFTALGVVVPSVASAGTADHSPTFSGTDTLESIAFNQFCCEVNASPLFDYNLGAQVNLSVSADWAPSSSLHQTYNSPQAGQTVTVGNTLTPGSGPLQITWSASGGAGVYDKANSEAPVSGLNVSVSTSASATATCPMHLSNDATYTCHATGSITLISTGFTVPVINVKFAVSLVMSLDTTLTISPAGVTAIRTTSVDGGATDFATSNLTLDGPTGTNVNDTFTLPCTAVGKDLTYRLGVVGSSPTVQASTSASVAASVTAGSASASGTLSTPDPGNSSIFNISTLAVTSDLGTVGADPSGPTVVDGGPYKGVEGTPIQFDASGSSDANCGPPTFSWDFGDGSDPVTGAKP
ncbi:MAG TPA: PKD domain-containing protein, partial [Acidimicrobiales bacterium]|nr:PKD domain-containing protein [Acidimicrobiales bacterium]